MARRLLVLNGLAILGVVLNHSVAQGFVAMFWWTDQYLPVSVPNYDQFGNITYYVFRLVEQLVAFSVPAFLFVSGFFIAFVGKGSPADNWKLALKRVVVLIIPYIIWSVITMIGASAQGESHSLLEYVQMLLFGRTAPHFYFIPLLIQLYLLSPLLILAAKRNWKLLLLISGLVQLFFQGVHYFQIVGVQSPTINLLLDLSPSWLFVTKMFWFVLGIVVLLNLHEFTLWLSRTKWLWLVLWTIVLLAGILEWEFLLKSSGKDWVPYYDSMIDSLYAVVFIFMFLAFDRLAIPYSKRIGEIGTRSYGIYLSHALFILYTAKAIYHIVPVVLGYQIILQPVLISAGLGVPLLLMYIVENSPVRKYYGYLFG